MVLGQAMFLGLTLVYCVARAGAVEELIHIFLMNEKWSHFVILTVALIAAAVAWSGHVVLHSAAKVWLTGQTFRVAPVFVPG
jgi:hypothetical protein